jgi:hypothetical protein
VIAACAFLGQLPAGAQTIAYPGASGSGESLEAWIGYQATRPTNGHSDIGYLGFTHKRDGGPLLSDGLVIRGEGAIGNYNPGSVDFVGASIMAGWRALVGPGYFTGYGGVVFENHDAPRNFALHAEGGFKAAIEYQTIAPVGGIEFYSISSYSTIADSWSSYLRPGWRLTEYFRLGPEASYFHSDFYEEWKAGAFVAFDVRGWGTFWLGGGWVMPQDAARVSDGGYVYVSYSVVR